MVYDPRDYWVLWTLSIVRYSKRTQRLENWICFRHQVREWEKPILLGPLYKDNKNFVINVYLY
jgi:hypothetical protein